jgi:hypothetical protein
MWVLPLVRHFEDIQLWLGLVCPVVAFQWSDIGSWNKNSEGVDPSVSIRQQHY